MKKYLLKKYLPKLITLGIIAYLCVVSDMNFNDSMILFFGLLFFIWFFRIIYFAQKNNPKKIISDIELLIKSLAFVWYVCSLKPLRKWLRKIRYAGFSPKPYPFLALYGSVLDTHMMKFKLSPAFYRDKTPAARAALWRLLTRGAVRFNMTRDQQPFLCLGPWSVSPSDGLDQDFEKSLYTFLEQCAPVGKRLAPDMVRKVISYEKKDKTIYGYDYDNQYRFADLLNTGIRLDAYSRRDIGNILGMERFLKGLPDSYHAPNEYIGRQPELQRVWPEYMTFAYLFGIEKSTWRHLSQLMPPHPGDSHPLYYLLQNSEPHRQVLRQLMDAVSEATPAVSDAVSAHKGRLSLAWHAEELYDI